MLPVCLKSRFDKSFYPLLTIVVSPERAFIHERIADRARKMIAEGLIEETQVLLANGCSKDSKPMASIGYRQVVSFLEGEYSADELVNRIIYATRQYAKRTVYMV